MVSRLRRLEPEAELPEPLVPVRLTPRKDGTVGLMEGGKAGRGFDYDIAQDASAKSRFFIVRRTPLQIAVNEAFLAAGYRGENVVEDLGRGHFKVEREGVALHLVGRERLDAIDGARFMESLGDLMGGFHTLSVRYRGKSYNAASHGHPHEKNIVTFDGGGLGLVDMKETSAFNIDWSNHEDAAGVFWKDYWHLSNTVAYVKGSCERADVMYRRLLSHYPMSRRPRAQLLDWLRDRGLWGRREPPSFKELG